MTLLSLIYFSVQYKVNLLTSASMNKPYHFLYKNKMEDELRSMLVTHKKIIIGH